MDLEKFEDVSDSESLTSEQEIDLLADSSQISQATVLVQTGELPLLFAEGDILPSSLMASIILLYWQHWTWSLYKFRLTARSYL